MDPLDYEGCSTMWFRNWDDAEAFFKSPEHANLAADCVHFMDTSKGIKVMAGYVHTIYIPVLMSRHVLMKRLTEKNSSVMAKLSLTSMRRMESPNIWSDTYKPFIIPDSCQSIRSELSTVHTTSVATVVIELCISLRMYQNIRFAPI
jgi:hypothetical protein